MNKLQNVEQKQNYITSINPSVVLGDKLSFSFDLNDRKLFTAIWFRIVCDIHEHFNTKIPFASKVEMYIQEFIEHPNITINDLEVFKNCVIRNKTVYGDVFYENKYMKEVQMRHILDWWNIYIDYRNRIIEDEYMKSKNTIKVVNRENCIEMPIEINEKISNIFKVNKPIESYIPIVDIGLTSNWRNELIFTDSNVSELFYLCLRNRSGKAIFVCADELVARKSKDITECIRLCGVYGRSDIAKYISEKI